MNKKKLALLAGVGLATFYISSPNEENNITEENKPLKMLEKVIQLEKDSDEQKNCIGRVWNSSCAPIKYLGLTSEGEISLKIGNELYLGSGEIVLATHKSTGLNYSVTPQKIIFNEIWNTGYLKLKTSRPDL